jgi:hypothetical protein
MEDLPNVLRSLALTACSCLLLTLPSVAQTNAGPNGQPQQSVLPTAFDTAAIQKAIHKAETRTFVFSGPEPSHETPKVCATPLQESKADPNLDRGIRIRVVQPKPDQAASGMKKVNDPIAAPPPIPACAAAKH